MVAEIFETTPVEWPRLQRRRNLLSPSVPSGRAALPAAGWCAPGTRERAGRARIVWVGVWCPSLPYLPWRRHARRETTHAAFAADDGGRPVCRFVGRTGRAARRFVGRTGSRAALRFVGIRARTVRAARRFFGITYAREEEDGRRDRDGPRLGKDEQYVPEDVRRGSSIQYTAVVGRMDGGAAQLVAAQLVNRFVVQMTSRAACRFIGQTGGAARSRVAHQVVGRTTHPRMSEESVRPRTRVVCARGRERGRMHPCTDAPEEQALARREEDGHEDSGG